MAKKRQTPEEKALKQVRYNRPAVANHIAKAVIKHNMDFEQAVRQDIAPELAEMPAAAAELAQKLEQASEVKQAIEQNLRAKGLDENSKTVYVEEMWRWMLTEGDKRAIAAARILGRGFIGEKIEANKPIELKIEGFGDGLKQMLGDTTVTAAAELPPTSAPVETEEEEEEESDGGFPLD